MEKDKRRCTKDKVQVYASNNIIVTTGHHPPPITETGGLCRLVVFAVSSISVFSNYLPTGHDYQWWIRNGTAETADT